MADTSGSSAIYTSMCADGCVWMSALRETNTDEVNIDVRSHTHALVELLRQRRSEKTTLSTTATPEKKKKSIPTKNK